MDDAETSALSGSPHGTAVLAEKQVKARGTKNRKWNAQNTGNIYISFVCHRIPVLQVDDTYMVQVAGSLAVLLALQDLGMKDLKMKWLNDIWVRGHKMAGVLVEDKGKLSDTQSDDPRKMLYILGIGVNINADTRRNPEIGMISTSAKCELKGSVTCREQFLAAMCGYLEELLPLDTEALHKRVMPHQLFCAEDHVRVHSDVDGKVTDGMIVDIHEDWMVTMKDTQVVASASWTCVWFSNESRLSLHRSNKIQHVFRRRGEHWTPCCMREVDRFDGCSVMM